MRGGAGLLWGTVGVCCASCVKVMNVGQWTDGDSWFVTQGATGGLRSWHWAQGRDHRESPSLWLRKAVPDCRLPPCQGGGQAWAHRPSWYLSATWQVLNMSCYCFVLASQFVKANSVTAPGKETLRPWAFSLYGSLRIHSSHMQPSVPSLGSQQILWNGQRQYSIWNTG